MKNKIIWRLVLMKAAAFWVLGMLPGTAAANSDALLDTLVRKGILTEQEAKDIYAEAEQTKKEATKGEIRLSWKDGLTFQSGDKKFRGKLGGRIQLDMAGFSEDDDVAALPGVGDIPAGVEFRRVRLALEGEYDAGLSSFYKVELDFAGGEVEFKDVYLGVNNIPVIGTIHAGHFKEPLSLEMLASNRYLTFMERATPVEAFAPERNTGLMIGNNALAERMNWAVGVFTETDDSGDASIDSNFRVTSRVSGLPWYQDDGRKLVHLGLSGSYINPDDDVRFRSRPEAHLAPRFVDTRMGTSDIPADTVWLAGAEAALVYGRFSLQGEYLEAFVDTPGESLAFGGFYVYGSWFLTGEHRPYRRGDGTFGRIQPKQNFSFGGGGWGAWELALRYSHLNLDDGPIQGGELNDVTAGVNWYLNPNLKIQLNYVYAMVDRTVNGADLDGEAHIVQGRFHIDF